MRLARVPMLSALILAATCGLASPALAQPTLPSDEAIAARLASAAEIADQNRRSEALNAAVNRRNAEITARNAAVQAAYDKAQADYQAALARHATDVRAGEAAYQKATADWQAAVAACKGGDHSKCQPASPQTGQP